MAIGFAVAATTSGGGISAAELSVIVTIAIFLTATIGGIVTFYLRRRSQTGTTRTSEAGLLWTQSQVMFTQITAERDRAIEQRDRLMAAQADQVIPTLSALLSTVQQLKNVLDLRDPTFAKIQLVLSEISRQNTDAGSVIARMSTEVTKTTDLVERLARKYEVL